MPKLKKTPSVLLGFDFGMRKIGVAVGQTISATASPLPMLKAQDGIPNWDEIAALQDAWQAEAFVVGMPYQLDGSMQDITYGARKFARRLENKFKLPTFLVDERLTTKAAQSQLKEAEHSKADVDSVAAVLILESWLRENTNEKDNET